MTLPKYKLFVNRPEDIGHEYSIDGEWMKSEEVVPIIVELRNELSRLRSSMGKVPSEEVDAGEFAEWLGKNGWRHHEHSMFWNGGKDFKTTSELLEIFKHQTGR